MVKDYQRADPRARAAASAATKMVLSPITGEMIPVDQMAEHMRISLIDPRWKQQRDAMLSKIRDTTKASDEEISRNLVGLARSRPDVFGAPLCLLLRPARGWHLSARRAGQPESLGLACPFCVGPHARQSIRAQQPPPIVTYTFFAS